MKLQYLSDNEGNTTAVVIPIDEWNEIKARHADIAEVENDYELSDAAKALLDERIAIEKKIHFLPFEEVQNELRRKYGL